ncbi:phosphoadenosine phosphosulfate reductase family protein [Streptomyces sp. NBC_01433]|uniref:phosphoadenosine phosphosulfate reductase family protein n=1 Tax=Streptomyces sp. NBC_01433 TaxID=2903864 RepID=UPI002252729C|nr:phosphoadenosine phosphosulfate reductase family protein [Streptomyces sp. NBC_01433]MCX4677685.1 phosphoadenosine phosphosulfate reductase family protein [Streptomyces sp. NBC_01433]
MPIAAQLDLFEISPAPVPKPKRTRRIHSSVPDAPATTIPTALLRLADWILLNSSGGKDSQAMASHVCALAAKLGLLHRVVIVHSDLGDIEWTDTRKLAEEQARLLGVRFEVVKAEGGDLLARTVARFFTLKAKAEREAREQGTDPGTVKIAPAWPSSAARWCTSDLKRGPIRKLMTRLVAELGDLGRPARLLNCLGQRAAESAPRAKLAAVEIDRPASNGRRHITTWRPIHGWTDAEVWKEIARSGLPYHEAYDWGLSRLSCSFCVLGCEADAVLAARLRPQKAAQYIAVEKKVGADFKNGLSMRTIVERAKALDAEHGELRRPPRGTALSRYVGKKATRRYLARVDHTRLGLAA